MLCADNGSHRLDLIIGDDHEGCTRVNDTSLGRADGSSVHLHIIESNLPEAILTGDHVNNRDIVDVTSVLRRVHSQ